MDMRARSHRITVYLSDEEKKLNEELQLRKGVDASGVLRQGMLQMAKEEGLPVPTRQPAEEK